MDWDWYKMKDSMGQFMSFNFVNDNILNDDTDDILSDFDDDDEDEEDDY